MADLTIEQKKALALANARRRVAAPLKEPSRLGPAPFMNKAAANIAGAPVDLATGAINQMTKELRSGRKFLNNQLRKVGFEPPEVLDAKPIENAFGGSESIKSGMRSIGLNIPERDPQNTSEYIGTGIGEAAGFATGGLGLASKAQKAKRLSDPRIVKYIKGLGEDVWKAFQKNPEKVLAAELAAGTGVGVAREFSEKNNFSPTQQFLMEFAGGLAGGGLTSVPTATGTLLRGGKSGARKLAFTYSKEGAFIRASQRMRELAENPELAVQAVDDLKGTKLLPSARTEDPGLMALEQAIIKSDPAEATRVSKHYAEAIQDLRSQILKSGESKSAREFLEAKRNRLFSALDARVERAGDRVAEALQAGDNSLNPIEFQRIAREGLEKALADAKIQEDMLWAAVPMEAKVTIKNFSGEFAKMWKTVPGTQKDKIPTKAKKFFDFLTEKRVKAIRFAEIDGLYKDLGELSANARVPGKDQSFFKSSLAEDLREALLEDMGNPIGNSEAKEAVLLARAFSREKMKKFRRGSIGRILGLKHTGEAIVPPESTLDAAVSRSNIPGMLAAREMRDAVTTIPSGNVKEATDVSVMGAVQDYVKAQFIKQATDKGAVINPNKAETFFRNNKEILDFFPDLKNQLQSAQTAEDAARTTKTWVDSFKTRYDSPSVSYASKYLNAPAGKEIPVLMDSAQPDEAIRGLLKNLGTLKNNSDKKQVMEGIRSSMSKWLLDKHTSTTKVDIEGNLATRGQAMKATLKQPEVRKAFNLAYTPEEFKRLTVLTDEIAKIEKHLNFKNSQGAIIDDLPAKFIELPVRYIMTKGTNAIAGLFGKGNAGTDIQLAQMTSNQTKNVLRKMNIEKAKQIIIEAHKDPELYKALLLNTKTAPKAEVREAYKKINSWMAGPGSRLLDTESEDN